MFEYVTPVGWTVNPALSTVTTPVGWGSDAEPATSIFACTVPVTLVSAGMKLCTTPRSIGVLSMWRSIRSPAATGASCAAARASAVPPPLKSAVGT